MLYKDYFTLVAFLIVFGLLAGFLLLFGITFLINKRLDVLAARRRKEISRLPERMFWKVSKWVMQGTLFISAGLFFLVLSGFTPAPIAVLWLFFFVVWGMLFLHKFRSISLPTNQFMQLQSIFDEEDDFAIDDMDINLASIPRKNHSIREKLSHYIFTCKLAIQARKLHFTIAIVVILVVTALLIFLTSCMCVALHPLTVNTGLTRKFLPTYCEPGAICNIYFTIGTNPNEFIMNFQTSEDPDTPFVWVGTKPHTDKDGWRSYVEANNAKLTSIDELDRYVCWADLRIKDQLLEYETTYYVIAGYLKGETYITSKEYKLRTFPENGNFSFVSGGDMSMDDYAHKLMKVAASTDPYFAMIGGDITYDNGFPSCYPRWDEWFYNWDKYMVTTGGYYIPILAAIGNHEAGGFLSSAQNDPYFSAYFPQQTAIATIRPNSRITYHAHRLTNNVTILALDSDVVERMDGSQAEWIEKQLSQAKSQNVSLKMALYHGNLYPSVLSEEGSVAKRGRQYWAPIFDKYDLTVAFENHCHAYKRTYPLRNNEVASGSEGVVYLGDGSWGVEPRAPTKTQLMDFVAQERHVYSVIVNQETISTKALKMDGTTFDPWEKNLYRST